MAPGRPPRPDEPCGALGRGCRAGLSHSGRGQARRTALARRDPARDTHRAILTGPAGRRLRGRLLRLALGPRPREMLAPWLPTLGPYV